MKPSTLTTIEAILQADTSVLEEQRNRIIKACTINQPKRSLGTLKQLAMLWEVCPKTAAEYARKFKIERVEYSQRKHKYNLDQAKTVNFGVHYE